MGTGRRLSEHFWASEFAQRDGTPAPDAFLYWALRLCRDYLEPLRDAYGPTIVHSGWRSPSHNEAVGGAPSSFHRRIAGRRGAAADVSCARGEVADWWQFLEAEDPPGLGLYRTHVHVDNRAGRARW